MDDIDPESKALILQLHRELNASTRSSRRPALPQQQRKALHVLKKEADNASNASKKHKHGRTDGDGSQQPSSRRPSSNDATGDTGSTSGASSLAASPHFR